MAYTRVKDRTSINNSLSTNDFKIPTIGYVPVKDRVKAEPTINQTPTLDFSLPPSGNMTTTPSFISPEKNSTSIFSIPKQFAQETIVPALGLSKNIIKQFVGETFVPALELEGKLIEKIEKGFEPSGDQLFNELSTKDKAIAFGKEYAAKIVQQPQTFVEGGLGAVSSSLGYLERFGWDGVKPQREKMQEWEEVLRAEDPDATTPFVSGAGSMATYYFAGKLIGATSLVAGLSPKIANIFGNSVFTLLESSSEAGSVYQDLLKQGIDKKEASRQADLDFGINVLLLGLTNKFDFTKQGQSSIVKQIKNRLLTGGREAIQELGQQVASNVTTYKQWNEGLKEAGTVGGVLGFMFGGSANPNVNINVETQQEIKNLIEQAKKSEAGFAKIPSIADVFGEKQQPIQQEISKAKAEGKTADEFITVEADKIINNLIKDSGKGTIKLYHGTDIDSSNLIKKSGIFKSGENQPSFFTTSKKEALEYAKNKGQYRGKKGDILEIEVPKWSVTKNNAGEYETHLNIPLYRDFSNIYKPKDIDVLKEFGKTDIFKEAKGKTFVSDIGKDIETKLKAKAPIIKERIKAEKKITKIKTTAREARDKIVNSIKNKVGTAQAIREDVVKYAKANLDLKEKGKLLATVKNAKTFKDLDKARFYIEKLSEEATKRMLLGKIHKEIKVIKVSGKKPKGKYTPEIQNTLNAIKKLTDLNQKNANLKLEENLKNNPIKVPQEIVMENYLLSLYTGSVKQKQELLSIIRQLKEKGEMASALKKFNIQADIQAKSDLVVDRVTGGEGIEAGRLNGEPVDKTKIQAVKQYLKAIGKKTILDWRGLMTTLDFNSSVKTKPLADFFSVSKNESKYKELQSKYKEEFDIAFSSIYDIKNKPNSILKKINSIATEKVKVDKYEMTRDELIKRYMEVQDPTLRDSFIEGNKYTEKTLDAIDNKISEQDKKLAEWQLKYYGEMYNKVNEVYRVMNGVDLPFNEFYSPIKRVGYTVEPGHTEFLDEAFYRVGVTNKSLISRVKNLKPISKQGSISVLDRHLTDTNYYIAWAEKIRELDSIFTNNKVMESIKQEFPTNILESITNKIQHISTHGNKTASRIGWVDYIRKNFVIGNLAVKPTLTIKQLVSTLAYLEKINSVSLISGTLDFIKNPVKNYKTLQKESSFIKTRGSGMERDIQDALKEGVFSRYNKKQNLANTLILNVKLGDKGAIVLGSWSLRKQRLKEGITLENIINEYEEFGAETQQSADISRLSEIQLGGSIEKLFTVFKSSQRAYLQKELNAVKSMFRKDGFGKENVKKVAKTLFIYHVLLPVVFQWIANMGGWDEEDRKEYKRAALLGSFNGLFIAGDIIDGIIRQVMGMRVWDTEVIIADIGDDIRRIISNLTEDDVSTEDFQTALDAMASAGTGVSGLPIEYSYDILESLYKGNYETSLKQTLGWSEYVIGEPKKGDSKLKQFEDRIKKIEGSNKLKDFEARIKKIQTR